MIRRQPIVLSAGELRRRLSRRQLLRQSLVLGASVSTIATMLAACSDDGDDEESDAETDDTSGDADTEDPDESDSDTEDTGGADSEVGDRLVIAGWGGRFTEATRTFFTEPFSEETGIEVEIVDAPGEQIARLMAQRQAGDMQWDLVDSPGAAEAYVGFAEGLFAPMPSDLRTELEGIMNLVNDWGFSFASLAFVLACNQDAAEACPTTPEEFWDTEQFPGPRVMSAISPLQPLTLALLADGVPEDELFPMDIDRAFAKLEELRPHVGVWFTAGDQMEQVLRDEEVVMGHIWSGRGYNLIDQGVNLEITWDKGIYDPGFWVVVDGAPNEAGAWQFIEWVAKNAEAQAGWSEEMGYAAGNPDAFEYMDEEAAQRLADHPNNFDRLVIPDWEWYAEHRDEIERRFTEFLSE